MPISAASRETRIPAVDVTASSSSRGASSSPSPGPAAPAAPEEPSAFQRVLHGIGREVERGEATVRRALQGGSSMGAGDLLALQAGVYRYSESVDLAAKLVDRATSGIRTVVQGQS